MTSIDGDFIGLQGFSSPCCARLFSGGVLGLLITASALAGTKPSQPIASEPADVAAVTSRKCPGAVVKDQLVTGPQSVSASDHEAEVLTATGAEVADGPEPPNPEILQDKLWSTNLSRSSKNTDVQKAPQCGITTAVEPPAN
jgi:hypothetical protein